MGLTVPQKEFCYHSARFRVLATGRRFGKTFALRRNLCRVASEVGKECSYIAPTYRQAKRIMWKMLKSKLESLNWIRDKNEQELWIELKSGSIIRLFGAENYDAMRGIKNHYVAMDECGDIPEEAYTEVIRATVADTMGSIDFAGSPKGRNWFYRFHQRGLSKSPEWSNWASFLYTTLEGGNVTAEEIENARNELDEMTFLQEYMANFVNFVGRAYYNFDHTNVHPLEYRPDAELIVMFDFNVAPGVCILAQEMVLPSGIIGTGIIGEIYIPQGSNTKYICETLLKRWGNHKGRVTAYGDASGGNSSTQGVDGSDWDIIDDHLNRAFVGRYSKDVEDSNPRERERINAVNSRVRSMDGVIRLMIDPKAAPKTIEDFEGTKLLEGGSGQLDKSKKGDNARFTHMTDAVGYYIYQKFVHNVNVFKSVEIF